MEIATKTKTKIKHLTKNTGWHALSCPECSSLICAFNDLHPVMPYRLPTEIHLAVTY